MVCHHHQVTKLAFLAISHLTMNRARCSLFTCLLLTQVVACTREHEPIGDYSICFSNGRAPVMVDGNWGFIDLDGHLVIPAKYDWTGGFSEGLAPVRTGDDAGYINTSGELVIGRGGGHFNGGLAHFYDAASRKFGYIDVHGQVRIPPKYELVHPFSDGLAAVAKDINHWGYIDANDNIVVDFTLESAWPHSEGLGPCSVAGDGHYYDTNGKVVLRLPSKFDRNGPFHEGLASVSVGLRNGYVDRKGNVVITPDEKYPYYDRFSEGLAGVKKNGKWGFCDRTGRVVIPPRFQEISSFTEGFSAVKSGGKWGFIDKTGEFVIRPQFDEAFFLLEGRAGVVVGKKLGYIDKNNEWVWKPTEFKTPLKDLFD